MPNRITAYQCQFKCGHAPFNRENDCALHEDRCIQNPLNRTCATCIWDIREKHSAGDYRDNNYHEWVEQGCYKADATNRTENGFKRNCESWNFDTRCGGKGESYTKDYLLESEKKTLHYYEKLSTCTRLQQIKRNWTVGQES